MRQNEDGTFEVEGVGMPSRALPPRVKEWAGLINQAAATYPIPAHFIAAIMALESGGNPNAVSPSGAYGLMQLLPKTARGLAHAPLSIDDIMAPPTNVDLGARFLLELWQRYHGNPIKVAFGYNAGGAYCGVGHTKLADGSRVACTPNRYNLVADCHGEGKPTVDYGEIVLGYANAALATGQFGAGLAGQGGGSAPAASPAGKIFAGVTVIGLLALAWNARS